LKLPLLSFTAKNRSKPIPVEEFSEHVQRMHADRDKFFELEYNVRIITIIIMDVELINAGHREVSSVRV
jgi:hypothetical protein